MFIKQIILKGFKSFKYGTYLCPFFPGINIIVGDKGSGKTNVLEAIEFMFNNKYANINENEEKFNEFNSNDEGYLYWHIINIFIDFNNSDKTYENLPEKFTIRRVTSSKTDDYWFDYCFNNKKMSRKEFEELLQTIRMDHFSDISIIKQEDIIQFATTSDKKRLDLLLNAVRYKKSEDLKQNESDALVENNNRTSLEVNKCHAELEKDDHRCKKSGIEEKRLIWIKKKFPQLEKKWKDRLERQKNKKREYTELQSKLEKLKSEYMKTMRYFHSLEHTEKELTKSINELKDHQAVLEASISISKTNNRERKNTMEQMNQELESLHRKIASEEKAVELMESELSLITANVDEIKVKYQEELWELDCLYVKLSKNHEPVSEEEKDKVIRKIMEDWQESFAKVPGYLKRQRASLEGENEAKVELTKKISLIKAKLNNLKTSRDNDLKALETLRLKIQTLTCSLALNPVKREEVSTELRLLRTNYEENRKKLMLAVKCDFIHKKTVIKNTLQSLKNESGNTINDSTYHGFAIDCFQCSPEIEVAVLAIASQRLFHFVFDYENDAIKVLQKISDKRYLNFISLNSLTTIDKTLPTTPGVFPLITKITYAPVHEKLVKFMFNNILVCRNVQEAADLSKKHKITCVTLHGIVFFSCGVSITKSWNENQINQIGIYRLISKQLKEIEGLEKYENTLHQRELSFKNTISRDTEQQNELKSQEKNNKQREVLLKRELDKRESELQSISVDDDKYKEEKDFVESLSVKVKEFELKLYNNDNEEMTVEEYQRHKELKVSTAGLFKLWKEEENKADELNNKITLKLDALNETKLKTKNDLSNKIRETVAAEGEENNLIKSKSEDLESTMNKLEEACKKYEEYRTEIEKLKREIEAITCIKNQQEKEAQQLKLDIDKNDTVTRDLELEYNQIRNIIEETFSGCELQERVYKQFAVINKNLEDIVKKFIPYGCAQLILMVDNQQYMVNEAKHLDLDGYTGVNIKFSESKDRPAQSLTELSDEQKTIITLALFLAIQKCNSPPIILCDEIDKALHSTHRQVLCTIIKEMSSNAQIFFTTSQPEVLQVGDNFCRVYKNQGISRKLNMQGALDFITHIKSGGKADFSMMPIDTNNFYQIASSVKVTELGQLYKEALKKLERQCYSALVNAIAGLARKKKCPPDTIINPISVREMSQKMPNSKKEMTGIRHVRENVFAKCGNMCLKITTQYAAKRVTLLEKQKKEEATIWIDSEDESTDDFI